MSDAPAPGEGRVTDLLAALEESVSAAKAAQREKRWRAEAECGCGTLSTSKSTATRPAPGGWSFHRFASWCLRETCKHRPPHSSFRYLDCPTCGRVIDTFGGNVA